MGQKLLVISRSVPPASTGSSIIVENIIRYFDRDRISVIGQKSFEGHSNRLKGLPNILHLDSHVDLIGRGQRYLKWLKFRSAYKEALQKAKDDRVTHILAIFPDEFYLYLGYRLSKELDIPYYTWFHNTYLDNAKGGRKIIAKRIQPKVFAHAKTNFVMSDGILNEFSQLYPNTNFKTLEHGFNIPKVELSLKEGHFESTKYVFTGSLNVSNEDAALRLFKCILSDSKSEIHIYSGNAKGFLESRGFTHQRIIYHGFVTLDQLQIELQNYDIMLLPHGFGGNSSDIEFKTIFPTRTIPLLYSSRPILAHTPSDVFLTEFLKKNQCAYVIDTKDEEKILKWIKRFKKDKALQRELTQNALKISRMFDINTILNTIKDEIGFEH